MHFFFSILGIFVVFCTIFSVDGSVTDLKKIFVDGLKRHNQYRARHGSAKLKFSASLTSIAQNYAQYLTGYDIIDHSSSALNGKIGENLYRICKSPDIPDFKNSILHATDSWYNEISMYDFTRPGKDQRTYHFTALIWANTQEVGFGVIAHKNSLNENCVTVVANYMPPGNVASVGDFTENVKRPLYK